MNVYLTNIKLNSKSYKQLNAITEPLNVTWKQEVTLFDNVSKRSAHI